MSSNTKNVKLGVCQVFFDGVDLGYTQGGVEVTVKTDTYKVNVDQFGKTQINEQITGRQVMAKVPLAETTLENLVAIMPGATLNYTGGAVATGSLTIATNPSTTETILVNGKTITFRTVVTLPDSEVLIGANAAATAANLAAFLQNSTDPLVAIAAYTVNGAIVTITYGNPYVFPSGQKSAEGNAFTLASGTAGAKVTVSGAALTGGSDPTAKNVSVTTGIGINLLDLARELRLHPIQKAVSDRTDDFVLPLANTPGALTFAYKLEAERIYNVEFSTFPDPTSGPLYRIGN